MSNSSKYYDLASLAEASYVLFDEIDYTKSYEVETALQDNSKEGHFSATQAADFVATWEVVSHQKDTESGFSATLFKNKETGNFFYACRGTAGKDDLFITDVCDIVTDGLAINQIVDMYNDWQRIQADKGSVYKAAKLELLVAETALLEAERLATPGFTGPYEMSLRTRNDEGGGGTLLASQLRSPSSSIGRAWRRIFPRPTAMLTPARDIPSIRATSAPLQPITPTAR
jgi:hypothetical protein